MVFYLNSLVTVIDRRLLSGVVKFICYGILLLLTPCCGNLGHIFRLINVLQFKPVKSPALCAFSSFG